MAPQFQSPKATEAAFLREDVWLQSKCTSVICPIPPPKKDKILLFLFVSVFLFFFPVVPASFKHRIPLRAHVLHLSRFGRPQPPVAASGRSSAAGPCPPRSPADCPGPRPEPSRWPGLARSGASWLRDPAVRSRGRRRRGRAGLRSPGAWVLPRARPRVETGLSVHGRLGARCWAAAVAGPHLHGRGGRAPESPRPSWPPARTRRSGRRPGKVRLSGSLSAGSAARLPADGPAGRPSLRGHLGEPAAVAGPAREAGVPPAAGCSGAAKCCPLAPPAGRPGKCGRAALRGPQVLRPRGAGPRNSRHPGTTAPLTDAAVLEVSAPGPVGWTVAKPASEGGGSFLRSRVYRIRHT